MSKANRNFSPALGDTASPRRGPVPFGVYPLSRLPDGKSRIFSRRNRFSKVFLILYLVVSLLILYVAIGHAAPPRSRGARPLALGNGYSAVSGEAYNLFYNPAGLAEITQPEFALDYGRSYSEGEPARSDFNGMYAFPYRYKDNYVPLAVGAYGEGPAPGSHIVEVTVGGGMDAPVDKWTKGFIKLPVKMGAALSILHQGGDENSPSVGKSTVGLGLSGGLFSPLDKKDQIGLAIRHLYAGKADPQGPSISVGILRRHTDFLHMMVDLEYGNGGIWRFHPGLEWLFYRGVVRPRLGWGYHDSGGVNTVATGIGFYVSPIQIDIAYLLPTKTVNDNAGQFRASLVYRFGKPKFSDIYFDRALEKAGELDQRVLQMSVQEAELKASLGELEQKRRMASEELMDMKMRIQALKGQDVLGERDQTIRKLQYRLKALDDELASYKSRAAASSRRAATIRTHKVKPGDTLQSLAKEYYGDPNQWKKIYNANTEKIERGLPKTDSELVIP